MHTTRMGFEPTRAEPIGLAVQRLNHSATSSCWQLCVVKQTMCVLFKVLKGISKSKGIMILAKYKKLKIFPTPGVEPGPPG